MKNIDEQKIRCKVTNIILNLQIIMAFLHAGYALLRPIRIRPQSACKFSQTTYVVPFMNALAIITL